MKFSTGSVFGDRYTLGERIAVGGMGEVWRAQDRVLGRTVAMKLLSPSLADQPGFTRRFREEARNTAMLSHPNIAAVYDYGEDAGASWLVMELVEGQPLSQIIKDDGPMDPRRVSAIIAQAASALQAAHDAGVIHRDVKPANILVRSDGQVKLTDFGIARATDAAPITRTGEVMGTAQYISPEQATGKPAGPHSDMYSLGVVAHEMLTGKRPFDEGSPVATAMAHIHNDPPPLPPSVGQPLAGVVMACLAKDPAHRPESGRTVTSALRGGPEAARFANTEVMPPNTGATQAMSGPPPTMVQPTGQLPPRAYPPPGYPPQGAYGHPGYPTGPMPEQRKRTNPWVWIVPLLLLLALGGFLLAQSGLLSGGSTPQDTPSTPAVTTEPTTPSPTETTPQTEQLNSAEFRGMSVAEASSRLGSLGFDQVAVNEQSDDQVPAGQVISINPSGRVTVGTPITLHVSTGPQPTQEPSPADTGPAPTESPSPDQGTGNQTSGATDGDTQGQAPPAAPQAPAAGANAGAAAEAAGSANSAQSQGHSTDGHADHADEPAAPADQGQGR